MYSTLLFYTVGVFTVAYVLGGQTLDFADKATELKNWQAKAKFYKVQTRVQKQAYVQLTSTPIGAIPNCPYCRACEKSPTCDADGCEACASPSDTTLASTQLSVEGTQRRRLQSKSCPACPTCHPNNENVTPAMAYSQMQPAVRRLLQSTTSVVVPSKSSPVGPAMAVCNREALLMELKSAEAAAHLHAPVKHQKEPTDAKTNAHIKRHAALKECLHLTMPAAAEAYEDALAAKLSGG